jgi:hypothetical protein
MPEVGRNTFPLTADGYVLPSGKTLTLEDARLIGDSAGLPCSIPDDHPGWFIVPTTGKRGFRPTLVKVYHYDDNGLATDSELVETNPIYRPYIIDKKPLPPLLAFLSHCDPKSSYTINLNLWKPTSNSKIQTYIPKHIRSKYELSC